MTVIREFCINPEYDYQLNRHPLPQRVRVAIPPGARILTVIDRGRGMRGMYLSAVCESADHTNDTDHVDLFLMTTGGQEVERWSNPPLLAYLDSLNLYVFRLVA